MKKHHRFLLCATVLLAFFGLGVSSLWAQNTQGKEFWLTFGRNQNALYNDLDLQIRIANGSQTTNVKIEFTNLKTSHSFSIGAQQVYLYELSETEKQAVYNDVQGVSDRSIHITTDHPVTVYALNSWKNSGTFTDVTNVFPVTNLGTEYYQISYMPYDLYSDAYAVIGIENSTNIYHNGFLETTIDAGEVYYRTSSADMTGAHITTNKPIAFFAVNQIAQIPANILIYDILIHQLAPVKTWGKNFFVPVSVQGKNIARIVASQNGTNIIQTGGTQLFPAGGQTVLTNLQAGDFVELEVNLANNGCYIQADKPVGVCAYLPSSFYVSPSSGDPAQSWLPAIEQTITEALIAPFIRSTIDDHYAIVSTSTNTKNDTRVAIGGGAPALLSGGSWVDNSAAGMSFYTMPLTDQSHSYLFTNPEGLIIMCYGFGGASSYYYLAGSALRDLTAAFFANNIFYLELEDHLFCENDIEFHAIAEETGTATIDSLKWYIDGTEHLPAQNQYTWNYTFPAENYLITLEVYTGDNEILTFKGDLHIGAQISTTPSPVTGGTTSPNDTCVQVGEPVTLIATPNPNYLFLNWTDDGSGAVISQNPTFSFTVMSDSALTAHFEQTIEDTYTITVSANPEMCGTATGDGIFHDGDTATVIATTTDSCCVFTNWTEDGDTVSTNAVYSFTVIKDRDLVANFGRLDFDTYAVIICNQVILLNLKKLAKDGYDVTGCKWYKNGIEVTETYTIDEFSFSEGPDKLLETKPTYYMYRLITKSHGELCSTEKIITLYHKSADCPDVENSNNLLAYPNPVSSGSLLTIEGVVEGSPLYVYNYLGVCVLSMIAGDNVVTLTLDLPPGIYLIRSEDKIVKIMIVL